MIIESIRPKETFNNKYWVHGKMLEAISLYGKNHDIELVAESSEMLSSVFIYSDDLSDSLLLNLYNDCSDLYNIDNIPVIPQKYFDECDYSFKVSSDLSVFLKTYKSPKLIKVIDWKKWKIIKCFDGVGTSRK